MSVDDVNLVVTKIRAAFEQGDRCSGMVFDKSAQEWTEIFNEAGKELGFPVVSIPPQTTDIQEYADSLLQAFSKAAEEPVLILVDTSNNSKLGYDMETSVAISNYTEQLTEFFPKAVFIQIITEGTCSEQVALYCMNPKTPRQPGAPIQPV